MHRNTWKGIERKIASYFGTYRTPLSGINSRHKTSSDSLHSDLYIEVKARKKLPFDKLFTKVCNDAIKEKKIPLIVLNKLNSHEPIIMCKLYDIPKINKFIIKEDNINIDNDTKIFNI